MYNVVGPDGGMYGPVDRNGLSGWIAQGRVTPVTWVVEAETGRRFMASELPGLFPAPTPYANPYANPYFAGPIKSTRTKVVAILLAWFLGCFGVHRFYMGLTSSGLTMLLITVLTCGIGSIVTGIWAIVDMVRIAMGTLKDDRDLELA